MRRQRSQGRSLHGCVILVVQRVWVIASALARAFKARGAEVLLTTNPRLGLALTNHPYLSAAVLDSQGRELCRSLEARGVPFLFYTGRDLTHEDWATAAIVRKPVPPEEVVEAIERLLRNH